MLFESLDGNEAGRVLIAGLAELHERHPELRGADSYFAEELRALLSDRTGPLSGHARGCVAFITEALRVAFTDWAKDPGQSMMVVWEILVPSFAALPAPSSGEIADGGDAAVAGAEPPPSSIPAKPKRTKST